MSVRNFWLAGSISSVIAIGAWAAPATQPQLPQVLIFEEPLVALGTPSKKDIKALGEALDTYLKAGRLDALQSVEAYLQVHPRSPWRLSLLVNLGLMYRHTGYLSKATEVWEEAWRLGKDNKDPRAVPFAHRALGELAELNAGLGRKESLELLLKEAQGRPLAGLVTEKLAGAKESLILMHTSPNRAYRCGPLALTQIRAMEQPKAFADPKFEGMDSTPVGTTLAMNVHRAQDAGMKLQMARRTPGAAVLVPAVVHWKVGHFSAVVAAGNGKYLVQDPNLGDTWVSQKVLDEESSGYALVSEGTLPAGWSSIPEQEGRNVWGRGAWGPGRPDDTRPDSHKVPSQRAGASSRPGIPVHHFHTSLASLSVSTNLIQYTPAKGPGVEFTVTYNQREYGQPQLFDYCNLGPKWTFTFLACLKDDTTNPNSDVTVCNPGGGGLVFRSNGDGTYAPEDLTQAVLTKSSATSYTIHYLNGRREFYTLADRAFGLRRIVLTKVADAKGDELNLAWDMNLRLVAIKDALGQVTTLAYEKPDDILKLTRITAPTGKSARLEYDAKGYLARLISQDGLVSTFAYGPAPECPEAPQDFMNTMTTPEGKTIFTMGEHMTPLNVIRWVAAKLPNGKSERLESAAEYGAVQQIDPVPVIPELDPGALAFRFGFRNSFYWGTEVDAKDQKDYAKAVNFQWGHGPGGFASGILITEKAPSDNRVFYVHAGEFWGGVHPMARKSRGPQPQVIQPMFEGGRNLVTRRAQIQRDGKVVATRYEYDSAGRLLYSDEPKDVGQRTSLATR